MVIVKPRALLGYAEHFGSYNWDGFFAEVVGEVIQGLVPCPDWVECLSSEGMLPGLGPV